VEILFEAFDSSPWEDIQWQLSLFPLVDIPPVRYLKQFNVGDIRFAGHETFACRATWLHKGLDLIKEGGLEAFSKADAVVALGVGRNMVLSIRYWVHAFRLVDEKGNPNEISRLILDSKAGPAIDPYLESNDSLWLLHHSLISNGHGTMYPFFFKEFFKRKSSRTFTESEVIRSLLMWLNENEIKIPSERSLRKDLKVLIDNYCPKTTGNGSEESMTNLLIDIGLIQKTAFKSDSEVVYELNHLASKEIGEPLFACMLMQCFESSSASLDQLFDQLGYPLIMDREMFIRRIEQVCLSYPEIFVYKDDAGLREVQCYSNADPLSFFINHHPELAC
jgi:hypothetical protein